MPVQITIDPAGTDEYTVALRKAFLALPNSPYPTVKFRNRTWSWVERGFITERSGTSTRIPATLQKTTITAIQVETIVHNSPYESAEFCMDGVVVQIYPALDDELEPLPGTSLGVAGADIAAVDRVFRHLRAGTYVPFMEVTLTRILFPYERYESSRKELAGLIIPAEYAEDAWMSFRKTPQFTVLRGYEGVFKIRVNVGPEEFAAGLARALAELVRISGAQIALKYDGNLLPTDEELHPGIDGPDTTVIWLEPTAKSILDLITLKLAAGRSYIRARFWQQREPRAGKAVFDASRTYQEGARNYRQDPELITTALAYLDSSDRRFSPHL